MAALLVLQTALACGLPFSLASWATLGLLVVPAAWGWTRAGWPKLRREHLPVLALSALAALLAHGRLCNRLDYDFWLDFPQQTMLQQGRIPLVNPYFPDLLTHGHYGRNLVVAWAAEVLGLGTLVTNHLLVVWWQLCLPGALYALARGFGLSGRSCLVLPLIGLWGIGVGGWFGMADNFYHHYSLATLIWVALLCEPLDRPRAQLALWLAANLLVFEINALVLICSALLLRAGRRLVAASVAAMLLAGALGMRLPAPSGPSRVALSPAVASESQSPELHLKWERPLQIDLQGWDSWRQSVSWDTVLGWLGEKVPTEGPEGYSSILGPTVWRMHWLGLWLLPWTVWRSWRRSQPGTRMLLLQGLVAYLIPGCFDFGPVYEAEYFRFEFLAGSCWALALGLELSRVGGRWAGTVVAVTLLPAAVVMGGLLWAYLPRALRELPRTDWTSYHLLRQPEADTSAGDLDAVDLLRGHLTRRLLTDHLLDPNALLEGETVYAGLLGVPLAGHAFCLPSDPFGGHPRRLTPTARLFWAEPNAASLDFLQADALVAEGKRADALARLPGLRLVGRSSDGSRVVFEARRPGPPRPQLFTGRLPLRWQGEPLQAAANHLFALRGRLRASAPWSSESLEVQLRSAFATEPDDFCCVRSLALSLPRGGEASLHCHLCAPNQPGRYKLDIYLVHQHQRSWLGESVVVVHERGKDAV